MFDCQNYFLLGHNFNVKNEENEAHTNNLNLH